LVSSSPIVVGGGGGGKGETGEGEGGGLGGELEPLEWSKLVCLLCVVVAGCWPGTSSFSFFSFLFLFFLVILLLFLVLSLRPSFLARSVSILSFYEK
jgi:hypothetical protein